MDTLTQQIYFLTIEINIFWGDLSGISAKTATLILTGDLKSEHLPQCHKVINRNENFRNLITSQRYVSWKVPHQQRNKKLYEPTTEVYQCFFLPFQPNHRLAHPENYLFLLSIKIFSGSKYPKNILFNFEKGSTEVYIHKRGL